MTATLTYPGVYIEEVPSGVRTITGVATSITAFIGRARRGPTDRPRLVQSFSEFTRAYGGLWAESPMTYAVQQYFLNGGRDALICRAQNGGAAATLSLDGGFDLRAASEGDWGEALRARVEDADAGPGEAADSRFNLLDQGLGDRNGRALPEPLDGPQPPKVREHGSRRVSRTSSASMATCPAARPTADDPRRRERIRSTTTPRRRRSDRMAATATLSTDGDISAATLEDQRLGSGCWITRTSSTSSASRRWLRDVDVGQATWDAAAAYAKGRRAMVIVDPPADWDEPGDVTSGIGWSSSRATRTPPSTSRASGWPTRCARTGWRRSRRAARSPASTRGPTPTRGVWKAPAGLDARPDRRRRADRHLTDGENGQLNPLGINCLRAVPGLGRVVWGARTLRGADQLASEWKYVPVRRMALFIEESLYPRNAVGRLRAERRAAVGADPAERRRVHAEPVPPGRVPGHVAARGVLREVRHARRRPRTTSTSGSSTSSSGSRRSSRPSSSSSRSSRWPARSSRMRSYERWPSSPSTRSASIPTRTSSSA